MTQSSAGFSLVEVLIAAAIMALVTGAVLLMANSTKTVFRVQAEAADLGQRLRVSAGALQRDLLMAGAGPMIAKDGRASLLPMAAVLPYRMGERNPDPARGVYYRADALSVLYVAPTPTQAEVTNVTLAGQVLSATVQPNCGAFVHDRLCGFSPGLPVLIFDDTGEFDTGVVSTVDGLVVGITGPRLLARVEPEAHAMLVELSHHTYWHDAAAPVPRLMHYDGSRTDAPVVDHVVGLRFEYFGDPRPPEVLADPDPDGDARTTYGPRPPRIGRDNPRDEWRAGENCAFIVADGVHRPRLAAFGAGADPARLDERQLTDGPWCPDSLHPARFDADLLRIRRVRAIVRVQAASDSLRGPRGPWFARPGTATSASALVPDQQLEFDISLRNLVRAR
jgi:prepilin-type N-terminal cleavage/methylation domain-containing protein